MGFECWFHLWHCQLPVLGRRDLEVPELCSLSALAAGCQPEVGKIVINALNFYEPLRFKMFTPCCRL